MILIVGAGLAGLSAAYHLRGIPYKILEREREAGGLCRSYMKDGFTFDYTGHLLHFRQTAIKALVEGLLPDQLQRHARKSYVYSHDTYTEYPFQVNTHGLPPEVVRECLLGFIATLSNPSSKPPARLRIEQMHMVWIRIKVENFTWSSRHPLTKQARQLHTIKIDDDHGFRSCWLNHGDCRRDAAR